MAVIVSVLQSVCISHTMRRSSQTLLTCVLHSHFWTVVDGLCRQLGPVVRSLHAALGANGTGLAKSLLECFIQHNVAEAAGRAKKGLAPATGSETPLIRPLQLFALVHSAHCMNHECQLPDAAQCLVPEIICSWALSRVHKS